MEEAVSQAEEVEAHIQQVWMSHNWFLFKIDL
jgi:hypothetical protein